MNRGYRTAVRLPCCPALVLLGGMLLVVQARSADAPIATDPQLATGWLHLNTDGRVLVEKSPGTPLLLEHEGQVRFSERQTVSRLGLRHEVELSGGQTLHGELLAVAADTVQLRVAWSPTVLTMPRAGVRSLRHETGWQTLLAEDGGDDLRYWHKTDGVDVPEPYLLRLKQPGCRVERSLPELPAALRFGVNFYDPGPEMFAPSAVELDYTEPAGAKPRIQTIRIELDDACRLKTPFENERNRSLPRAPGWHRLQVETTPNSLLVTIDELVLVNNRTAGPTGRLTTIRLLALPDGPTGKNSGARRFSQLTLARPLTTRMPSQADGTQDEICFEAGDQLLGTITKGNRLEIELNGRTGPSSLPWCRTYGGVRAVRFRHQSRPPSSSEGEHVRLWLDGFGPEPDTLDGVVTAVAANSLSVRHHDLGAVTVPRSSVRQLRWFVHGRRIELAPKPGPEDAWHQTFNLDRQPPSATLVLRIAGQRGNPIRLIPRVNGTVLPALSTGVGTNPDEVRELRLELPGEYLRRGANQLEVIGSAARRIDTALLELKP